MALAYGTNCGFVTTAPTTDPVAGATVTIDNTSVVLKATSQSNATKVIEVGWWCDNATEAANFEVGLYSADGAVVPGEAGTRLFVSATNAKGTTSGWKVVTGLNWTISASTIYWIGLQVDNTATATSLDNSLTGGTGYDRLLSQTTLNNPYGGGGISVSGGILALYALVEVTASGPANLKTYNTNPTANIKTINTNVIANVKTLNTNP